MTTNAAAVAPAGDEDRLMTTAEVASYCGVPIQTLYQWRLKGDGPRFAKIGRHLRSRRAWVDAWVDEQADPIL